LLVPGGVVVAGTVGTDETGVKVMVVKYEG
jgi:hypothetical protein